MERTIDLVEMLFVGMAFLSTIVAPLGPYYVWFLSLAFLTQLYDAIATRETVDYVILLFMLVPLIALFNLFTLTTSELTFLWFIILAIQLYDVYESV